MYLPPEVGIVDVIQDCLVDLFQIHLVEEIDADDVSQATTIKVGPLQASPTRVVVLIHENDPDSPRTWRHQPHVRGHGRMVGVSESRPAQEWAGRATIGATRIGGGCEYERSFTLEVQVWGNLVGGITVTRRDVAHIAAVVTSRALQAMLNAKQRIGSGSLVQDDFGESVIAGPYLGDEWAEQEEGESLRVIKYMQFWYHTDRNYG